MENKGMEEINRDNEAVFDKTDFLTRVEDDMELAKQLGQMFLDDAHKTMKLIRERIEQSDSEGTMRAAHSLKGASANLSAYRVRRTASELEQAANRNDLSHAEEMFSVLEQELKNFEAELKLQILD